MRRQTFWLFERLKKLSNDQLKRWHLKNYWKHQNKDILIIFLLNSGLIGLVGGIGGIIVGFFASTAISSLGAGQTAGVAGRGGIGNFLSSAVVTPQLIIGALLISMLVGMIAGVIPAYRASKLNPVEALRYEWFSNL